MAYQEQVVRLPFGELGLTGNRALSQTPPQGLLLAHNISYDLGNIRKEGGAVQLNAAPIGGGLAILGGHEWWPTAGVQRSIVYTNAGSIRKDSGSGTWPDTVASGMSTTAFPVFAEGGQEALATARKLFICNGVDQMRVLIGDAANAFNVAGPAADWTGGRFPVTATHHDGRMWAGVGNRVYFSTLTDHEDFAHLTNAGSLAVGGAGEDIVQIMSYKGALIVWKYPTSIYYIDTTSPDVVAWKVKQISNSIGGVSPQCAVQVTDDVLFLDQSGNFQLLSGIQEYGEVGLKNLSHNAFLGPFIRSNVALRRLNKARAVFYAHKLEAHFAVPGPTSQVSNVRIVVDFNTPGLARFRWSDRDECPALWLYRDSDLIRRPVIGDTGGNIWALDRDIFTKGSAGYQGRVQTPHYDFGWLDPSFATRRKNGGFLEVISDPTGAFDLNVDVFWDGIFSQTITFSAQDVGSTLGTFILGTDALGTVGILNARRRVAGSGKRVSFRFYNPSGSDDFNISQIYFSFSLGDEAIR